MSLPADLNMDALIERWQARCVRLFPGELTRRAELMRCIDALKDFMCAGGVETSRWACLACSTAAGVVDDPTRHISHAFGEPCPSGGVETPPTAVHRCSGCFVSWAGIPELNGAELCGDCWRKVQPVLHGGGIETLLAEVVALRAARDAAVQRMEAMKQSTDRDDLIDQLEVIQAERDALRDQLRLGGVETPAQEPPDSFEDARNILEQWMLVNGDAHWDRLRHAMYTVITRAVRGVPSSPPPATPHEHNFQDFTVCAECGQTEAAIEGCHHCDEVTVGKRCWWCLRVRGVNLVSPPPVTEPLRERELEWVLHRAEEIVRDEHGKDVSYAFVQAWGELPQELRTPLKPIEALPPTPEPQEQD